MTLNTGSTLSLSPREMARLECKTFVPSGTGVKNPVVRLYEVLGFKTVLTWVQCRKDFRPDRKRTVAFVFQSTPTISARWGARGSIGNVLN
jgi:hypothetical protein